MKKDVQQRLVELRNEMQAQKVYSGLSYSSLLLPENTPTGNYSGTASLSGSGTTPVARIRFRFIRTDGLVDPPLINFAYSASYSPTYKQFAESYGFVFSANDLDYITLTGISGYIAELGDGYVDFYVEYSSYLRSQLFALNSIDISVQVQAIVSVNGRLEVERLI